jgi:hypothetical protein
MASIRVSIDRMSRLLQDRDHMATTDARKHQALAEEVSRIARMNLLTEIRQAPAISGQGRYPLPLETLDVAEVLYDGTSLWEVSEESLRNTKERWEESQRIPKWWTQERQPLTADSDGRPLKSIEVSPAPALTGGDIPVFPAAPLAAPVESNFVILYYVSPQIPNDETAEVPIPRVLQQVAVYSAVAELSGQKSDYEDRAKMAFFDELAKLMISSLET